MVRIRVQLTEGQYRRLKCWSGRLGISVSEAIRRCVTERLSTEEQAPSGAERVRAALALAGKYADPEGATRVAIEHDRYVADAYRS